ncbi:MAG: hypothetical protein Q8K75_05565 [Chlamydiales bacterium]|nr:hypothetical protein [Chlamydiales bacterium]
MRVSQRVQPISGAAPAGFQAEVNDPPPQGEVRRTHSISELIDPLWAPIRYMANLTVVRTTGRVTRDYFVENTPLRYFRGAFENMPDAMKNAWKKTGQVLGTMAILAPSLVLLGVISDVGGQIASPLGWGKMFVSDTWSGIAWTSIGLGLYTHFRPLRPHIAWGAAALYGINNYTPFAGFVPAPWDIVTGNSGALNLATGTAKFVWNIPTEVKVWTATILVGGVAFLGLKKAFTVTKAIVWDTAIMSAIWPVARAGWRLVQPGDGLS